MLTHEQTVIRQRDAEIMRLRKENEQLSEKLKKVRKGIAELIRDIAKTMNPYHRAKAIAMADELEADV